MKPRVKIDSATTPDGTLLELFEHDGDHEISVTGAGLMGTRQHHSEEELARLACADIEGEAPRVMVGGLGMGFTLRAALDVLPARAKVLQVELLEPVVAWNRGPLAHHAGRPLDDPRVQVVIKDVAKALAAEHGTLDALMLDVDNGSAAMVVARNRRLYGRSGLATIRRALRPGGRVAFWSAGEDPRFALHLRKSGFTVTEHVVHARPGRKGARHAVIVGVSRPLGPGGPSADRTPRPRRRR